MMTDAEAVFWAAFKASGAAPADADQRYHSSFGVGEGSEAGASLILSGRKTATSSLPQDFGRQGPPRPGDLSILTAGERSLAVIETLSIRPLCLRQMDAAFAEAYAEWPGPEAFRAGMLDWYRGVDPAFTEDSPLLAERFRVLWRPPAG